MRLENENVQDIAPFGVRMPSELKSKIKASAKINKISMNAEIVKRLESTFPIEGEIIRPTLPMPESDNKEMKVVLKKLDAMERLMEEIRKSNVDLSKLKRGEPIKSSDN